MKILRSIGCRWPVAVVIVCLFMSCEKEEIMMYRQEAGLSFWGQASAEYSFFDNPGAATYVQEIRVVTTGDSVDYDRHFTVAVVENDTNYESTARPEQYKLLEGVIPAGKFEGTLPVEIVYTPDMDDSSFVVYLKLLPGKDFPLGGFDGRYFGLKMTNKLVKPKNWGNLTYYLGSPFSSSWYNFILDVIGMRYIPYPTAKDEDVPWVYNEMLANVGKIKSALLKYNLAHPNDPLRHDDGDHAGELVEMP